MEPLPETAEALRELTRLGDVGTAGALLEMSRDVEQIVPDIRGLSLTLTHEHLTFTMISDGADPGGDPLAGDPVPSSQDDPPADDEAQWQRLAQTTASEGIASTLSMPILHNGVVTADVDLYASTCHAFDDHHEALAQACGALAGGAVTNADLEFSTRLEARQAPERIRAAHVVDQAVGAIMSRSGVDLDEAEDQLRQAAERAGLSEAKMARAILTLFHASCGPDPDVAG